MGLCVCTDYSKDEMCNMTDLKPDCQITLSMHIPGMSATFINPKKCNTVLHTHLLQTV